MCDASRWDTQGSYDIHIWLAETTNGLAGSIAKLGITGTDPT